MRHSSALTSQGRLFMWGYNGYGQLGDTTGADPKTPVNITNEFTLNSGETLVSVELGELNSSALTSQGRLFMWGDNSNGQIGDGTKVRRFKPTDITSNFNLNSGETLLSVSLSYFTSSALTSQGRVFMWGYNGDGQLGDGTTINRLKPVDITNNFNLNSGETILSVSLGDTSASALTSQGRLFVWGYYESNGSGAIRYTPVDVTSIFTLNSGENIVNVVLKGGLNFSALSSQGRFFMWGYNGSDSYLSTPLDITGNFNLNSGETILSFKKGGGFSSLLTSHGLLLMWGYNGSGQLGDGTTIRRDTPVDITSNFNLNNGETILSVSLGGWFSSALTSQGRLFMWGPNDDGQFGNGTTSSSLTPLYSGSGLNYVLYSIQSYSYQSTIPPYTPTKEGYIFDGWYTDADFTTIYIFGMMPANDLNLYGKWIVE
jgi:uncharacterized repeat protein (TIGR02543 family)